MIEVFLFSLSISIDAFGYAMGFGTRNIHFSRSMFLILNIINALILILTLAFVKNVLTIIDSDNLKKLSCLLLFVFGLYYVCSFLRAVFLRKKFFLNNLRNSMPQNSSFGIFDFLFLLMIFIFENLFSSIVFYSSLSNETIFVSLVFVFHLLFFWIGHDLGKKVVRNFQSNTSLLSGMIFIVLAFMNYFE